MTAGNNDIGRKEVPINIWTAAWINGIKQKFPKRNLKDLQKACSVKSVPIFQNALTLLARRFYLNCLMAGSL